MSDLHSLNSKDGNNMAYKLTLGIVAIIVIAGASFWGGIAYQKNHMPKATTATASQTGGLGGRGGGFRNGSGVFGSVTAISDSSITVQDTRTNTSKTLTISSSTTITNNGTAAAATDIQVGDMVVITTDTTNTSQATRILINPSRGGFGGSQTPSSSDLQTQ